MNLNIILWMYCSIPYDKQTVFIVSFQMISRHWCCFWFYYKGAVWLYRCCLTFIGSPIINIRLCHKCLTFMMGIPVPGKIIYIDKRAQSSYCYFPVSRQLERMNTSTIHRNEGLFDGHIGTWQKNVATLQTKFLHAFSWVKMFGFWY